MRLPVALAFLLLVLTSTVVYPDDDATALLSRIADRIYSLDHYYLKGTFSTVVYLGTTSESLSAPVEMAGHRPGRMRMQVDHELMGMTTVSSGETTWTYANQLNQYTKTASTPVLPDGRDHMQTLQPETSLLGTYLTLVDRISSAEVAGTELVVVNSEPVECKVLVVHYDTSTVDEPVGVAIMSEGPDTLWVDPDRLLPLRSVHRSLRKIGEHDVSTKLRFEFDLVDLDSIPPTELFAFVPPPGAEEVEQFGMAAAPAMEGRSAPAFSLTSLDGKKRSLDQYRGRVVLLDFWATWCAPCRKELPHVEALYRRYGKDQLVVFAINTSEARGKVEDFIRTSGYSFPVLLDTDGSVMSSYGVTSIPQIFVIDREGKIAVHLIGLRSEDSLLAALASAGVE